MSTSLAQPARTRRSAEAAKENILTAAEKILIEEGPQHLKVIEVAKAAGVAHATVLHHFGSIDEMQQALMTRMIRSLVDRIVSIAHERADLGEATMAGISDMFDTFEGRGVARLAAWLELTGESKRLTVVRGAVREVIAARAEKGLHLPPEEVEDFMLASICLALGVGLFGARLSALMERPADHARQTALHLLQTATSKAWAGEGC
jgi:AcrR family transcriptional regulator